MGYYGEVCMINDDDTTGGAMPKGRWRLPEWLISLVSGARDAGLSAGDASSRHAADKDEGDAAYDSPVDAAAAGTAHPMLVDELTVHPEPAEFPWFDPDAYLRRISYEGSLAPDEATLRALHLTHLAAVPFENLDIHLGRPIILEEERIYSKIVRGRRGGFCYELNCGFALLLRALGYNVTLLSAGTYDGENFGPEFDHMTLLVHHERRWLVDVGFGDAFAEPLLLDEPEEQTQRSGRYRIENAAGLRTLLHHTDGRWVPLHRFTLRPRRLSDFAGMCDFHQLSPDSPFPRRWFCSRLAPEGRITVTARRLRRMVGDERIDIDFAGPEEALDALRVHFGIDLRGRDLPVPGPEPASVG